MRNGPIDFDNLVLSDTDKKLWEAVEARSLEDIRAAVEGGGNLDMIHNYKFPTPLIQVAMDGDDHLDLLKEMVGMGATLNMDISEACPLSQYDNAFDVALRQDQYKAASLLIDLGADVNFDKESFHQFVTDPMDSLGKLAMAKKMFDHGAHCDETVLESVRQAVETSGGYNGAITFMDNWWEDGALNMGEVLEKWMRERDQGNTAGQEQECPIAISSPGASKRAWGEEDEQGMQM